ncbi:hypothetical protein Lepto1489_00640 [Leptospira interrogans serovar Bataviae]|uniref:Uncharacterized protein n=1 Tax=Leptospira interrogans serovar Bataviae TaxID=312175 RepID=A0AAQ0B198_LEPIR|nr:hypothetical protein Lepto1489_00640 [Leptospira interrogans serovar Bataviae]
MGFSKINSIVCFNTTETNEEFIFQKLYSNFLKNILKNEYTHFKILEKHFD